MAEWGTPAVERIQKASRSKILEYVVLLFQFISYLSCVYFESSVLLARVGAVASWLVRSTPDRAVLGSSPGRGYCLVFFGKILYSHSPDLENQNGPFSTDRRKRNRNVKLL